jgi:hypothetical protein
MDFHQIKQRVRQTVGIEVVRSKAELLAYNRAVDAFERDGDRARYFRSLFALGFTTDQVRWHAAHPGERVPILCDSSSETDDGHECTREELQILDRLGRIMGS